MFVGKGCFNIVISECYSLSKSSRSQVFYKIASSKVRIRHRCFSVVFLLWFCITKHLCSTTSSDLCISPAKHHLFKVNNRNTKKRCEICSKSTMKTSQKRHWSRSGVFVVNSEHISHLSLVFLLLNLNK